MFFDGVANHSGPIQKRHSFDSALPLIPAGSGGHQSPPSCPGRIPAAAEGGRTAKPSTKVRTQDAATSAKVARKRHTEPPTLVRQMRGDLDSIRTESSGLK